MPFVGCTGLAVLAVGIQGWRSGEAPCREHSNWIGSGRVAALKSTVWGVCQRVRMGYRRKLVGLVGSKAETPAGAGDGDRQSWPALGGALI